MTENLAYLLLGIVSGGVVVGAWFLLSFHDLVERSVRAFIASEPAILRNSGRPPADPWDVPASPKPRGPSPVQGMFDLTGDAKQGSLFEGLPDQRWRPTSTAAPESPPATTPVAPSGPRKWVQPVSTQPEPEKAATAQKSGPRAGKKRKAKGKRRGKRKASPATNLGLLATGPKKSKEIKGAKIAPEAALAV